MIIATSGVAERESEIDRAIQSVLAQRGLRGIPIVVLNGDRFSPEILSRLENNRNIRFVRMSQPGVSNARLVGRRIVDTSFFSILDDDDEILPTGLATCLAPFGEGDGIDVVTANGFRDFGDRRELIFDNPPRDREDLVLALMAEQWLGSGSAVFKSETVGEQYFEALPDILEWTYLALRLSLERRVKRLSDPVFIKHEGTSAQVTSNPRYFREAPIIMRRMLRFPLSPAVRSALERKLSAALHLAATRELEGHDLGAAWRYHLQSMFLPSGIKYATFTRHLLMGLLPRGMTRP